jgi:hypothetical protein
MEHNAKENEITKIGTYAERAYILVTKEIKEYFIDGKLFGFFMDPFWNNHSSSY